MQVHRFQIGENVEIVANALTARHAPGQYTVVRLMPNDGADREYRVRHNHDGHERVVRQSEIRRGPLAALGRSLPPAE
ncbi:hypothetical protein LPC08_04445 [Roseomonas sp. OT10]|uniref:hypothetical protein n=1 Tax=Roseomonas cutis TaxID=2897332 RepID=UPI001E401CE8|nr:hypothetical protein [Roseomonas sp. OT10]UFN49899.1 hypothetical protein LPC08_04445 [Roseomonas sp. OT10]